MPARAAKALLTSYFGYVPLPFLGDLTQLEGFALNWIQCRSLIEFVSLTNINQGAFFNAIKCLMNRCPPLRYKF